MDLCTLTFGQLARTRAQHERGPNVPCDSGTRTGPAHNARSTRLWSHRTLVACIPSRAAHCELPEDIRLSAPAKIASSMLRPSEALHPDVNIPPLRPDDEEPRAAMLRRCRKCLGNGIGEVRPTAAEVRWHFGRCSATLLLHRQQLPRCRDPMMDLPSRTRSASPNARLARQQARQRLRCSCRRRLR